MLDDLLKRLPHASPFRFVTRLLDIEPGASGRAQWVLSGDEDFFQGHFPGRPLVPGVLLTEALAQLSGIVAYVPRASAADAADEVAMLLHTDLRFKRPVTPPATVDLASAWIRTLGAVQQFQVQATVNGNVAAKGTLTLGGVAP